MKTRVNARGAARAGGALQCRDFNHTVSNQALAPGRRGPLLALSPRAVDHWAGANLGRRPSRDHRGSGARTASSAAHIEHQPLTRSELPSSS